jgi:hypothetical protein
MNGAPFPGGITYTNAYGDQVAVTPSTTATAGSVVGQYANSPAVGAVSCDAGVKPSARAWPISGVHSVA